MSWNPPIGIPAPNWGATIGNPIDLPRPNHPNDTPPEGWTGQIEGRCYVTPGSGTDTDNAWGYPGNGRETVPATFDVEAGHTIYTDVWDWNVPTYSYVDSFLGFNADPATDLLTTNYPSKFTLADPVIVRRGPSASTMPGGLTENATYYVIPVGEYTFKLATSAVNANANTPIDITSNSEGLYRLYVGRGFNTGNGYPASPRAEFPALVGGMKCFINGDFAVEYAQGLIHCEGTATAPVWVMSYQANTPIAYPVILTLAVTTNKYTIFDGIQFADHPISIESGTSYICFRKGSLVGTGSDSSAVEVGSNGVIINGGNTLGDVEQIVLSEFDISYPGSLNYTAGDPDMHCVQVKAMVRDVWVLDSELSHTSGNGVQITSIATPDAEVARNIYVGRCLVHHTAQPGLGTKRLLDCVFSQNVIHTMRRDAPSSPNSSGITTQYGTNNLWLIGNTIYNCQCGISIAGSNTPEGSVQGPVYIVGNVFYDIKDLQGTLPNPSTTYKEWNDAYRAAGVGIFSSGSHPVYVINNTFDDCDAGFYTVTGADIFFEGNIFTNKTPWGGAAVGPEGYKVVPEGREYLSANGQTSVFANNIFEEPLAFKDGAEPLITTVAALNTYKGVTSNSATAPTYENAALRDYRLASGSNGIDDFGVDAHSVYDLWATLYDGGTLTYGSGATNSSVRNTIALDRSSGVRPWAGDAETGEAGGAWDIGAYEYGSATYIPPIPPTPPTAPTISVAHHFTPVTPSP